MPGMSGSAGLAGTTGVAGTSGLTGAAGASGAAGSTHFTPFGCPRTDPVVGSSCDWSLVECQFGECLPGGNFRSYACCGGVWYRLNIPWCN